MRWRYRTILFEFQKDRVFGDKYIDDEEVENTLNEQGAQGWELVNVTSIREGLLAICKRPERAGENQAQTIQFAPTKEAVKIVREVVATTGKEPSRNTPGKTVPTPVGQSRETSQEISIDLIGDIKIR